MTPTVVLLHGLARGERSMAGLRRFLEGQGMRTWSRSYPSRRMPIAELSSLVAGQIREEVSGEVFGVTHSLGGILVRHMALLLPWRGVVMLAPPNQGSRVARRVHRLLPYRWFYGPAGQEVATGAGEGWPPPPRPFAVIAGTLAASPFNPTSWLTGGLRILPRGEKSDGTVTVAETRLPDMADFRTVRASHTFIMDHPQVRAWVLRFFREGKF